jgi:aminoglycoside phosphotransferase (APT) family kinase protein
LHATQRVITFINRTHGTDFALERRFDGGFQNGAYALRAPDGSAAVLKWTARKTWACQVERAEPVVAAARDAGWPTPAWLLTGTTPSGYPYQIQEYAEGSHPDGITRQLAQAVLPVLDIQAGLEPKTDHDWAAYDHAVVFADESGFTSTLTAFSVAGAEFVETMRTRMAPYRGVKLRATDLVHGDFNAGNIFLLDGRVSAVVDVEALGKGSRFHDLATLVVYARLWDSEPGAVADLLAYADRHAEPGELEVTYASSLLGLLAFLTEHHPKNADTILRNAADRL